MRDDADPREVEQGPLEAAYRRAAAATTDAASRRHRRDRLMAALDAAPDAPALAANEPRWRGMPRRAGLVAGVAVMLLSAGILLRIEHEGGPGRSGAELHETPFANALPQAPVPGETARGNAPSRAPQIDAPARERVPPQVPPRTVTSLPEKARVDRAPPKPEENMSVAALPAPSTLPVPPPVQPAPDQTPLAENAAAGVAEKVAPALPAAPAAVRAAAAVPQGASELRSAGRVSSYASGRASAGSAIHWASVGNLAGLRSALDRGDDPNQADASGKTSLHLAVMRADSEMVKLLIERGANPELADRAGVSPLDWARRLKRDDLIALMQR
jgi:Ankyrin repeats (3 copies)